MSTSTPSDPMRNLLITYNDLNSLHISTLTSPPSALEFLRFVSQNRPFVVRGGASDWPAISEWNISSLKEILKGQEVNVAVTPEGNADSPTRNEEGEIVFVKPWEEMQPFDEFIDFVAHQELVGGLEEVRYAQTQNDNIHTEYLPLLPSIPPSISFARLALQQDAPDAINLWIGNSHSVTSLHKDPYQNIYVQILGSKSFVLLPPVAVACVEETELRPATYARDSSIGLKIVMDKQEDGEEAEKVPVAMWDPDSVEDGNEGGKEGEGEVRGKYKGLVTPMRVKLEQGDMLYLPALWYHKVSQECSEEGICVAVNYWYDMEFGGSFWPLCNFVRDVALQTADSGT